MNKNIVIVVVLGLLIVISAVQAFQLMNIKTELGNGNLNLGTATKSASVNTGTITTPSSLDELDTMVGGC